MLTEKDLLEIESRVNQTQKGLWKAYIEGRDHESGSHFIMTGVGSNDEMTLNFRVRHSLTTIL